MARLTPEERAEKLVNDESWGAYDYRKLEKLIAAQIAEAYEEAAKIVEEHTFDCARVGTSVVQVIDKIRALAKENLK